MRINNIVGETIDEITVYDDEIIIVEKANGCVRNAGGLKDNEGFAIKSTCETENVIIVHENHLGTSANESFINNKLSVESETNLAIEMLDTVLEAEDESDSTENEINSQRSSSRSINRKDVIVPISMLSREVSDEKSPANTLTETINLQIIDPHFIRSELEAEIDEILKHAQATVESKLNEQSEEEDEDDENVFKNRKFLTRLSDLISSKSNQKATSTVQSKTLERKSETTTGLKHSKSVPNLKLILDSVEAEKKSFNDDSNVEYILSDDEGESNKDSKELKESLIPPPPIFSAELFERVATLKQREKLADKEKESEEKAEKSFKAEDEDAKSLEDESVNKENFRDKLEKLLSVPPTRLSLIAPVPLPRTSLIRTKDDNQERQVSSRETPTPISATIQKQRELFDEVLKKIKRNDNDEQASTVE